MTLTTTFVNKTTLAFKLKEGNAGVYKELGTLAGLTTPTAEPSADNKKTLEFDARSTYKEYRAEFTARSIPIPIRIPIRSNDVLEYATIYIVRDPANGQNFVIQGDKRSEAPPLVPSWFARLLHKLFNKR